MPRRSVIRCPALRDLAFQVRFAPRGALLKQVERVEALAAELEQGREYPDDWLVFRLTGFIPEMGEPALRPGAELLADLSALVEHLCDKAKATPDDAPGGSLSIEDLCARWGVTRKTIERLRRRGLIARRVREPVDLRRVRLAFAPGVVEWFEVRHPRLEATSPRAARVSGHERANTLAWARRFHQRTGCSLHTLAVRLSRRTGRSIGAMRRLLGGGAARDIAVSPRITLSSRRRAFAWRAERWGIAPRVIGERLGVKGPPARRAAALHRLSLLRAVCRTILPELGEALPATLDALLALPGIRGGLGRPLDLSTEGVMARANEPSSGPARERELAMAWRALLVRAALTVRELDLSAPLGSGMDEAETDLRWAAMLERELLGLAAPIVARSVLEHASLEPAIPLSILVGAGVDAARLALPRFDPAAGGRLAGALALPLSRTLAHIDRAPYRPVMRQSWNPWWLAPPPALVRGIPLLADPKVREALRCHWGLAGNRPQTIVHATTQFGLSALEFAAAYRRALRLGALVQQRAGRSRGA